MQKNMSNLICFPKQLQAANMYSANFGLGNFSSFVKSVPKTSE